jgi:DNA (cytosine-5)-methyltransferase 1
MEIKTFFDMCSGIGGGRLGLERAGLKSVGRSDTSRLSDQTYKLMFGVENEKNFGNLKRIKLEQMPDFDVLIAGFPCQTFSVIGRKAGFTDIRGQIIFHIARILKEKQPSCFILENVRGLVTHNGGESLKTILAELNNSGFDVTYKVLTSLDYGVPQMRQRVYFVGINKKLKKNIDNFKWPEPIKKPHLKGYLIDNNLADKERLEILGYYLNNPENHGNYKVSDLKKMEGKILDTRMSDLRIYEEKCPTLRSQRDGILYVRDGKIYQLTGYEALLLQGFPKRYANKVKDKVSDRHLLMQAGNAMTVNVIQHLGEQIKKFMEGN